MKLEKVSIYAYACVLLLALLWVYFPGLGVAYDFHDSFYSYVDTEGKCSLHPQWNYFFYMGRPLLALINCVAVTDPIDTLQDTVFIRLQSFFVLSLSALAVMLLIQCIGYSLVLALAVALGLASLPSMQLFIYMTGASGVLFSIPFVLLAVFFFVRWVEFCVLNSNSKYKFKSILYLFLVSVFLMFSSLIYQQMSSLFFVFVCLLCLSPKYSLTSRNIFYILLFSIAAYGIHGIVYLIAHNHIILPYAMHLMGLEQLQGQDYDVVVSYDFTGKISFFFTDLLQKGLHLWSIDYAHPMIQISAWLLPLSILFWCMAIVNRSISVISNARLIQVLNAGLVTLVVISLSLILTNAPNLVADFSSVTVRHLIAFQALIIAIICIGLTQLSEIKFIKKHAAGIMVCLVFAFISTGLMQARQNFDINMSGLARQEITYIRDAIAPRMNALPERIVVIQPHVQSLALSDHLPDIHDESGRLTTHYHQDVRWIVLAAFLDLGGERNQLPHVEVLPCCSVIPVFGAKDLVIDMRIFAENILQKRIGFLKG